MRHAPLSNVKSRDKEMRYCCHTAVRSSCRCSLPESRKSQHNTTAPGSAQRCTQHRWLFTAWVQLPVFKDTVALFGISRDFGAFLKKKNLPLRQIPSSQYSLASQLGGKGS